MQSPLPTLPQLGSSPLAFSPVRFLVRSSTSNTWTWLLVPSNARKVEDLLVPILAELNLPKPGDVKLLLHDAPVSLSQHISIIRDGDRLTVQQPSPIKSIKGFQYTVKRFNTPRNGEKNEDADGNINLYTPQQTRTAIPGATPETSARLRGHSNKCVKIAHSSTPSAQPRSKDNAQAQPDQLTASKPAIIKSSAQFDSTRPHASLPKLQLSSKHELPCNEKTINKSPGTEIAKQLFTSDDKSPEQGTKLASSGEQMASETVNEDPQSQDVAAPNVKHQQMPSGHQKLSGSQSQQMKADVRTKHEGMGCNTGLDLNHHQKDLPSAIQASAEGGSISATEGSVKKKRLLSAIGKVRRNARNRRREKRRKKEAQLRLQSTTGAGDTKKPGIKANRATSASAPNVCSSGSTSHRNKDAQHQLAPKSKLSASQEKVSPTEVRQEIQENTQQKKEGAPSTVLENAKAKALEELRTYATDSGKPNSSITESEKRAAETNSMKKVTVRKVKEQNNKPALSMKPRSAQGSVAMALQVARERGAFAERCSERGNAAPKQMDPPSKLGVDLSEPPSAQKNVTPTAAVARVSLSKDAESLKKKNILDLNASSKAESPRERSVDSSCQTAPSLSVQEKEVIPAQVEKGDGRKGQQLYKVSHTEKGLQKPVGKLGESNERIAQKTLNAQSGKRGRKKKLSKRARSYLQESQTNESIFVGFDCADEMPLPSIDLLDMFDDAALWGDAESDGENRADLEKSSGDPVAQSKKNNTPGQSATERDEGDVPKDGRNKQEVPQNDTYRPSYDAGKENRKESIQSKGNKDATLRDGGEQTAVSSLPQHMSSMKGPNSPLHKSGAACSGAQDNPLVRFMEAMRPESRDGSANVREQKLQQSVQSPLGPLKYEPAKDKHDVRTPLRDALGSRVSKADHLDTKRGLVEGKGEDKDTDSGKENKQLENTRKFKDAGKVKSTKRSPVEQDRTKSQTAIPRESNRISEEHQNSPVRISISPQSKPARNTSLQTSLELSLENTEIEGKRKRRKSLPRSIEQLRKKAATTEARPLSTNMASSLEPESADPLQGAERRLENDDKAKLLMKKVKETAPCDDMQSTATHRNVTEKMGSSRNYAPCQNQPSNELKRKRNQLSPMENRGAEDEEPVRHVKRVKSSHTENGNKPVQSSSSSAQIDAQGQGQAGRTSDTGGSKRPASDEMTVRDTTAKKSAKQVRIVTPGKSNVRVSSAMNEFQQTQSPLESRRWPQSNKDRESGSKTAKAQSSPADITQHGRISELPSFSGKIHRTELRRDGASPIANPKGVKSSTIAADNSTNSKQQSDAAGTDNFRSQLTAMMEDTLGILTQFRKRLKE